MVTHDAIQPTHELRKKHFYDLSAEDIGVYVGSLSAFASAQIRFSRAWEDEHCEALAALRRAAANVQIDCVTGLTVRALAIRIRQSTRISMIYEQYCDDLVRATRLAMQTLTPLVAIALAVHMQLDDLIEDARFVHEAVQEAYDALYGEPEYAE